MSLAEDDLVSSGGRKPQATRPGNHPANQRQATITHTRARAQEILFVGRLSCTVLYCPEPSASKSFSYRIPRIPRLDCCCPSAGYPGRLPRPTLGCTTTSPSGGRTWRPATSSSKAWASWIRREFVCSFFVLASVVVWQVFATVGRDRSRESTLRSWRMFLISGLRSRKQISSQRKNLGNPCPRC